MPDYLTDKSNKFCLRCPAFLRNGRHDFCDKCLAEAAKENRDRELADVFKRINGVVK